MDGLFGAVRNSYQPERVIRSEVDPVAVKAIRVCSKKAALPQSYQTAGLFAVSPDFPGQ